MQRLMAAQSDQSRLRLRVRKFAESEYVCWRWVQVVVPLQVPLM